MQAPAGWVKRHIDLVRPGGRVVDVAAGRGRHAMLALQLGYQATAIDRNADALGELTALAARAGLADRLETRTLDLETAGWPLAGETFDGVIVSHYLYRPHFPALTGLVAPGGVLIYETFSLGNEAFGRPSNPDFLLRPNELLEQVMGNFDVIAFEDLLVPAPASARKQRIVARRRG